METSENPPRMSSAKDTTSASWNWMSRPRLPPAWSSKPAARPTPNPARFLVPWRPSTSVPTMVWLWLKNGQLTTNWQPPSNWPTSLWLAQNWSSTPLSVPKAEPRAARSRPVTNRIWLPLTLMLTWTLEVPLSTLPPLSAIKDGWADTKWPLIPASPNWQRTTLPLDTLLKTSLYTPTSMMDKYT